MKKIILISVILLVSFIPVNSGIWGSSQAIEVKAGKDIVSCNFWVYSTIPNNTSEECLYSLSFPNLNPFVKNVTPNNFMLREIPCPRVNSTTRPSEVSKIEKLRMECLMDSCEQGDGLSCKRICVTFTGPTKWSSCITNIFKKEKEIPGCPISLGYRERKFEGGVADTIKVNRATVSNAVSFKVIYVPINILPHLTIFGLILGIGIIICLILKTRTRD